MGPGYVLMVVQYCSVHVSLHVPINMSVHTIATAIYRISMHIVMLTYVCLARLYTCLHTGLGIAAN